MLLATGRRGEHLHISMVLPRAGGSRPQRGASCVLQGLPRVTGKGQVL